MLSGFLNYTNNLGNSEAAVRVVHAAPGRAAPVLAALARLEVPHEAWDVRERAIDLAAPPPDGIWYGCLGAAAALREEDGAARGLAMLRWLEGHARPVVNGSAAFALAASRSAQLAALAAAGIPILPTEPALGLKGALAAADRLEPPLLAMPDQGHRRREARRFADRDAFALWLMRDALPDWANALMLVQTDRLGPAHPLLRLGFVDGRPVSAVRIEAEREGGSARAAPARRIAPGLEQAARRCLREHGVQAGEVEFALDPDGGAWGYGIRVGLTVEHGGEDVGEGARAVAGLLQRAYRRHCVEPLQLWAGAGP